MRVWRCRTRVASSRRSSPRSVQTAPLDATDHGIGNQILYGLTCTETPAELGARDVEGRDRYLDHLPALRRRGSRTRPADHRHGDHLPKGGFVLPRPELRGHVRADDQDELDVGIGSLELAARCRWCRRGRLDRSRSARARGPASPSPRPPPSRSGPRRARPGRPLSARARWPRPGAPGRARGRRAPIRRRRGGRGGSGRRSHRRSRHARVVRPTQVPVSSATTGANASISASCTTM